MSFSTSAVQVAQHRALEKAGVPREAVEAELHRVNFARVLKENPIQGRSFLDACVMGMREGHS